MPFITVRPASATWRCSASVPITNADAPGAGLGQQVLHRAADGDHVGQRGLHADAPTAWPRGPRRRATSCWWRTRPACRPRAARRSPPPSRRRARRPPTRSRRGPGSPGRRRAGGERAAATRSSYVGGYPAASCPGRSLPILALCALLLAACGADGAEESPPEDEAAAPAQTAVRARQRLQGGRRPQAQAGRRRAQAHGRTSSPDKTYEVKLQTNCGSFTIRLDQKTAPNTAASFVSLARNGLLRRHRLPPDRARLRDPGRRPDGHRQRRPGLLRRVDKPPADTVYTRGVVAMAKTGDEPPGTAGSQFYVVTGAGRRPAARSTPCSARSSKGMDVAMKIDALGDPQSGGPGTPLQTVVIEKATSEASASDGAGGALGLHARLPAPAEQREHAERGGHDEQPEQQRAEGADAAEGQRDQLGQAEARRPRAAPPGRPAGGCRGRAAPGWRPAGGAIRPMIRSRNSWRPDGASWPSFSTAALRSSGRRSASAIEAFIICRSAGRSCGWQPASASLK